MENKLFSIEKENRILEALPYGVLIFDFRKKLVYVNEKACRFLNIKKEVIDKASFSKLKKLSKLNQILSFFNKRVLKKEIKFNEEMLIELSVLPLKINHQKGKIFILENITQEKIQESMRNESVLITTHQLRSPLSAIKWSLKMLLDEELGSINKEQRNLLTKVYEVNEKMIKLIDGILSLSKIEKKKVYNFQILDICSLVSSVFESYKEQAKRKRLNFKIKIPSKEILTTKIDREKIKIVLQNFLDNAIRYTPPGGEILLGLKREAKYAKVFVKDTGIGIPQFQQKNVFKKFFRATNAIKEEIAGSGLGLFVSKEIIKAHKGKIGFKSKENKGSTFWFSLPLVGKFKNKI